MGNVRATSHEVTSAKQLLLWKSNKYYTFLSLSVWVGARAQARACARVGLLIQYATRMRHIACVLAGSTIFFDIISQTTLFSGKKLLNIKCVF